MATFTKEFLSGGTGDGLGLKITPTVTAGTIVHTAESTPIKDEIFIYAFNTDTDDVIVTLEWGGVVDPSDLIETVVPATDGLHLLTPGLILSNDDVVKCFASVENVIVIYGFVNRIT
jgi:hypothetical protein